MQETLTGVPQIINRNKRQFNNEHGTFHVHSILFLDGTKATLNTKNNPDLPNFKVGEECKYHILEHLKDDVKKIKYGEPWTGGSTQAGPATTETADESAADRVDSIVRQCCAKAAGYAVAGSNKQWQATAEEMYKWIMKEPDPTLEWQDPPKKDEDDDLPF